MGPDWWQAADGLWYDPHRAPGDKWDTARPAAWPTTQPTPGPPSPETRQASWIVILGGVVTTVSAFLPWMTATAYGTTFQRNSLQMGANSSLSWDGIAILALGLVSVLIGISRLAQFPMPDLLAHSPTIPGLGIMGMAAYDGYKITVNWVNPHPDLDLSVGYGVWVCGIAGLVVLAGGLSLRKIGQVEAS